MKNKNLFTPPFENEKIHLMTPEEKLWAYLRLNTFQCRRHFEESQKNPNNSLKYDLCLAYHLSPSARQCITKEFLDSDDQPSEEIFQCFAKNMSANIFFKSFPEGINDIFVLNRPYMAIAKERLKSGSPKESYRKVCHQKIWDLQDCNLREAEKRNMSNEELAMAIDAKQSDLCFKELLSIDQCVLSNFCARELQTCTKNMMKEVPQMSYDEAFERCFNAPSAEVKNCLNNTYSKG